MLCLLKPWPMYNKSIFHSCMTSNVPPSVWGEYLTGKQILGWSIPLKSPQEVGRMDLNGWESLSCGPRPVGSRFQWGNKIQNRSPSLVLFKTENKLLSPLRFLGLSVCRFFCLFVSRSVLHQWRPVAGWWGALLRSLPQLYFLLDGPSRVVDERVDQTSHCKYTPDNGTNSC